MISTNLTERMILSNENVMKYFPYVVFYEQQKKSETVKVSNIFVSCKLQKCITSRQCVF